MDIARHITNDCGGRAPPTVNTFPPTAPLKGVQSRTLREGIAALTGPGGRDTGARSFRFARSTTPAPPKTAATAPGQGTRSGARLTTTEFGVRGTTKSVFAGRIGQAKRSAIADCIRALLLHGERPLNTHVRAVRTQSIGLTTTAMLTRRLTTSALPTASILTDTSLGASRVIEPTIRHSDEPTRYGIPQACSGNAAR